MSDEENIRHLPQTPRVRCGLYVSPSGRLVRITGWALPPPMTDPVATVIAIADGERFTVPARGLVPLEAAHKMTIR